MNLNEMDTPMLRDAYRALQAQAVRDYFKSARPNDPKRAFNEWVSDELAALDLSAEPRNFVVAAQRVVAMVEELNEYDEAKKHNFYME
jgi:hypothetical protein